MLDEHLGGTVGKMPKNTSLVLYALYKIITNMSRFKCDFLLKH
jgi:hypothetical protein